MPVRAASHAGSWYTSNGSQLSSQLDQWLDAVPPSTHGIGKASSGSTVELPSPGSRVIIAPHAGYAYSGPAAAWAYKALDVSNAKRVFLLGPSHHAYLSGCALSRCDAYETPLGDLRIDKKTVDELEKAGTFDKMSQSVDEAEHSLEMHLPYIYKILSKTFTDDTSFPPLVPIMVGATSASAEKRFGAILAPYLADPSNVFVISSDFAHWGSRFRYTYYVPSSGKPTNLGSRDRSPTDPPIHESIARVDGMCMDAIEEGKHDGFLSVLEETENTVCGRHPIGVVMAAIETLEQEGKIQGADGGEWAKGRFRFVRYERSSDVESPRDSSVSYCSGFAVL